MIVRWSWIRGGHFSPAGIDGVHTCLYYYRPVQHMTVLRVIHAHTYTLREHENQRTTECGYNST